MLVFEESRNRSTRRKPLGAEKRTNKLNPHMTPDLEIEPRPHWWKASPLTTASSLHPNKNYFVFFSFRWFFPRFPFFHQTEHKPLFLFNQVKLIFYFFARKVSRTHHLCIRSRKNHDRRQESMSMSMSTSSYSLADNYKSYCVAKPFFAEEFKTALSKSFKILQ